MIQDRDYFRRRADEARKLACSKDQGEKVAVAGELALAYAALARRLGRPAAAVDASAIPLESA